MSSTGTEDIRVKVLRQPQSRGYGFLSQNDPEIAIAGASNDIHRCPTIRIHGYTGLIRVVVSCVTKTPPYRAHPCMLRGESCSNGVYTSYIHCSSSKTFVYFRKLCIEAHSQHSISVEVALKRRQELKVDPFQCGFDHINYAREFLDLNAVRLCFQVFIQGENVGSSVPLLPVVSDIIYNSKIEESRFCINIMNFSDRQCPADGGTEGIYAFCEGVSSAEHLVKIKLPEITKLTDMYVWTSELGTNTLKKYSNTKY